ncbi:hypothetical protein FHS76_004380 [Ochrobactrum daejeonense]|uniref:Uncharacterized protein n=1 Tax=Brucella daejeonensis TaxID=659015 RepID=A0A7W9B1E2_9HYPH|nr:hypothetical protein [Brucella daejeonensis]
MQLKYMTTYPLSHLPIVCKRCECSGEK